MQQTKKLLYIMYIMMLSSWVVSCGDNGTLEDKRRIDLILQKYGNEFTISLESELYVRIDDLNSKNGSIGKDTAIEVYKMFFFNKDQLIRPSDYVYLNTYDSDGEFVFQIGYDIDKKEFIESSADHY